MISRGVAITLLAVLSQAAPRQHPGGTWPVAGESVQECGLNCVLLMSRLAGRDCVRSDLLPVLSTSREGASMADIRSALQRQGFGVAAVTADFDSLMQEKKPAILHLQGPAHFVLAVAYGNDHALLADFPRPPRWVARRMLERRWTRKALVVSDELRIEIAGDGLLGVENVSQGGLDLRECRSMGSAALAIDQHLAPGQRTVLDVSTLIGPAVRGRVTIKTDRGFVWEADVQGPTDVSIAFDHIRHDFGKVRQGEKVSHDFVFANLGDDDANITGVEMSCACSVLSAQPEPVAPGQTGRIGVELDTAGKKGFVRGGFTAHTSDSSQPTVDLVLEGIVLVDVSVVPTRVYFGRVGLGESPMRRVVLTDPGDDSLRVEAVLSSEADITMERAEQTASGEVSSSDADARSGAEYYVSVRPTARVGMHEAAITFRTNAPSAPEIVVPVHFEIVGPVEAVPQTLFLGEIDLANRVQKKILLRGDTDWELTSAGAECENASVEVECEHPRVGKSHELTVTVSGTDSPGRISGNIVVSTNLSQQTQVVVPLLGYVVNRDTAISD